MKLVCVHPGDEWYGADKMLYAWIATFRHHGWDVTAILPTDVEYSGQLSARLEKIGVSVKFVDFPVVRRRYLSLKGLVGLMTKMRTSRKKLLNEMFDADVALYSTGAVVLASLATRPTRGRRVLHLQEYLGNGYLGRILSLLIRLAAVEVVCCSNAVRAGLHSVPNRLISVIHNGSLTDTEDATIASWRTPDEGARSCAYDVLLVGRLQSWKGQDQAVRALSILKRRGIEASLALVGSEPPGEIDKYVPGLKLLALQGGVADNVYFAGQLDPSDVSNYLATAKVVLNLSTKPDPFPIATLEAMRGGCAVLVACTGGLPEMIADSGVLVDPSSADDIADALRVLLADDSRRHNLGIAARARWERLYAPAPHRKRISDHFQLQADLDGLR